MHHIKPISNIQNTMEFFVAHKIPMGIVSNKRSDFITTEIEFLGWGHYFPVCLGSGDTTRDKPFPDPLLEAMNRLNLSNPKEIWYVGDTIIDLEAGIRAGMQTIILNKKSPENFESDHTQHATFFESCTQFHDFCVAIAPKPAKT